MYDYIQGKSVNKNVQEQLKLCHFRIVCETYMVMYHVNTHLQYKTAHVLQPYLKQHNFTIQYKNLIVFRDNLLKIIKIHQLIP